MEKLKESKSQSICKGLSYKTRSKASKIPSHTFMPIDLLKSIDDSSVSEFGIFIEFTDNLKSSANDLKRMRDRCRY